MELVLTVAILTGIILIFAMFFDIHHPVLDALAVFELVLGVYLLFK